MAYHLGSTLTLGIISGILATIIIVVITYCFKRFRKGAKFAIWSRKSGIRGIYSCEDECYEEIKTEFKKASVTKLKLVDGQSMIGHQYALLYEASGSKLSEDKKMVINVLLLSPKSSRYINSDIARKCGQSEDEIRENIKFGIKKIFELKRRYEKTQLDINLRLYDELPVWKLLIFDNKAFVRGMLNLEGISRHRTPMYCFEKADKSLFIVFDKYFNSMWEKAYEPKSEHEYS